MDANYDLFCKMLLCYYHYNKGDVEICDTLMDEIGSMPRDGKLELDFVDKVFIDIIEMQKEEDMVSDEIRKLNELKNEWVNSGLKDMGKGFELAEEYLVLEKYEEGIEVLLK